MTLENILTQFEDDNKVLEEKLAKSVDSNKNKVIEPDKEKRGKEAKEENIDTRTTDEVVADENPGTVTTENVKREEESQESTEAVETVTEEELTEKSEEAPEAKKDDAVATIDETGITVKDLDKEVDEAANPENKATQGLEVTLVEEAQKSFDVEQLNGVFEAISKSLKMSSDVNEKQIEELSLKMDTLASTVTMLASKVTDAETVAKSFAASKDGPEEAVEDKAVGYVAKSVDTVVEEAIAGEETAVEEATPEEADFDLEGFRKDFLEKFSVARKSGKHSRGELESIRGAYLRVGDGLATEQELKQLDEFLN